MPRSVELRKWVWGLPNTGMSSVKKNRPATARTRDILGGQQIMVGPTNGESEASTERRDAESRWQQAELRILELAATESTIAPILNAVTAAVDEALPDAASSILLVGDGDCLRYGSAPRLPESYNTAIDGLPIGPAQG